jgi:molecular chaperone IbpA
MLTYDLSPMFRHTVGFDRMQRLMDAATSRTEVNYPPYNIETDGKDAYRITVAVAGFDENNLDVTFEKETLTISGNKSEKAKAATLLHHGIAGRNFQLNFNLADHIRVNSASLNNGMLAVDLQREVPEELKQRKIDIKNQSVNSFNDETNSFANKEKKAA